MTEVSRLAVADGAAVLPGILIIASQPPWSLGLTVGDREYRAQGRDLFDCLAALRRELELENRRICCAGALQDVFPSGMTRQMAGGRKAYRHSPGRPSLSGDLVDIFEPADCQEVVTVAEQEAWMRKFFE